MALCPEILKPKKGRGRRPKHSLKEYAALIVVKEEKSASLREAETDYSEEICPERVDHSVIHYWEKKLQDVYVAFVRRISQLLVKRLKPTFKIIDSTKFVTWRQREVEFHTLVAFTEETVFPLKMFFGSTKPRIAIKGVLEPGEGHLMCDAWYDDNTAMGIMFEQGYIPIVKPIPNRYRGFWRRKAREIFGMEWLTYRQRSRGESNYGALTNAYGDRLVTTLDLTTKTRIGARVAAYLVKLYIRASSSLRIIRNALHSNNLFKDNTTPLFRGGKKIYVHC